MKVKEGICITTYCNICQRVLREDYHFTNRQKKFMLRESIKNLGDNRHKCQSCFKKGMKSKWKVNLSPLKVAE